MPSVNEEILDLQIRHQVGIQRLSSSTVQKLVGLLNESDKEIVEKLLSRGPTLEGSYTSKRLQSLLDGLRELNHDVHVSLGKELSRDLRDIATYEAKFQKAMLGKVVPVAIDYVMPTSQQITAIINDQPFGGALLKESVKGLEDKRIKNLSNAVRLGMLQGETTSQIVTRVRGTAAAKFKDGILATSKVSAERLTRTAVNHVANAASEALYAENADLIKGVQWVATLDTTTCPTCGEQDGKVYLPNKGPRPPRHLNCRCATIPITKSWKEMGIDIDDLPPGTRASMDGQVPATENWETWLKKQSPERQDDVLGKKRGRLYRDGKLEVKRFLDTRGEELTLDALAEKEAVAFELVELLPKKPTFGETIEPELVRHVAHFSEAPETILKAIEKTPSLNSISDTVPRAHYIPSQRTINMNLKGNGGSIEAAEYGVVWRHEYGHHIDYANRPAGFATVGLAIADIVSRDAAKLVRRQVKRDKFSEDIAFSDPALSAKRKAILDRITEPETLEERQAVLRKELGDMLEGTGISADDVMAFDERVGLGSFLPVLTNASRLAAGDLATFFQRFYMQAPAGEAKATALMLCDLLGAATKNKVGFGHSQKYYNRGRRIRVGTSNISEDQTGEIVANYTAIVGGSSAVSKAAERIARALLPEVMAALDRAFVGIGEGRSIRDTP